VSKCRLIGLPRNGQVFFQLQTLSSSNFNEIGCKLQKFAILGVLANLI